MGRIEQFLGEAGVGKAGASDGGPGFIKGGAVALRAEDAHGGKSCGEGCSSIGGGDGRRWVADLQQETGDGGGKAGLIGEGGACEGV